ncbi:hypothetical protein [Streptomyces sp. SBT349]|uniref:hypothetical protein n=1 Tax=Streptomyces sp. SBT349 TaxID=1580539 RepID=UPI00066C2D0D|nr:hypothetical protein [Streptomyces sp. SBT349]
MSLGRVVLNSRRWIDLSEVRLSSTYGGMMEGYPTKRVNDFILRSRVRVAEEAYPGRPVHLVPPVIESPEQPAGRTREPVEMLPAVACIGAFESSEIDPAHDSGWYVSMLTVVWFQPTADIPSEDGADPALRDLAWEELARDFEL